MGKAGIREVPRAHSRPVLDKCVEFLETARSALRDGKWNAAGLNAIHSGISAADAALIASAGVRSIAEDHGAVIGLLESEPSAEFTMSRRRQLTGLLKLKNQVAYDRRLLTEVEARQLADHAARLAKWAEVVVIRHLGPRS